MEETVQEYKWQDIEVLGFIIQDFSSHIQAIYTPLTIFHFASFLLCGLSMVFLLFKSLTIEAESNNSAGLLPVIGTTTFICTFASGGYLYFLSSVLYGAGFDLGFRLIFYFLFFLFFVLGFHFASKKSQNSPLQGYKIYGAIFCIIACMSVIFASSLGDFYG